MTKKQIRDRIKFIWNNILDNYNNKQSEFLRIKNNVLKDLGLRQQYIPSNATKQDLLNILSAYEIAWDIIAN